MSDDNTPSGGFRSFLTETHVGSTTPPGCIMQLVLTGLAAAPVVALVLAFA